MMNIRLCPMGRRRCHTARASNSFCRYAFPTGSTCHVTYKVQIHPINVWAPFSSRHCARSARHPVTAALGGCRAVLPLRHAPSSGAFFLAQSRRQTPYSASHSGRPALRGGGGLARRRPPASAPAPGAVGRPLRRRRWALLGGGGFAPRGLPPVAAAHGAVERRFYGRWHGLWARRGLACLARMVAAVLAQLTDLPIAPLCGGFGFCSGAFFDDQHRSTSVRWLDWGVQRCASCLFPRSHTPIPCAPHFPHLTRLPCGPCMSVDTTAYATTMPVYIDSCSCGWCSGSATTPPSALVCYRILTRPPRLSLFKPPSLLLTLRHFPPPTPPRPHFDGYPCFCRHCPPSVSHHNLPYSVVADDFHA